MSCKGIAQAKALAAFKVKRILSFNEKAQIIYFFLFIEFPRNSTDKREKSNFSFNKHPWAENPFSLVSRFAEVFKGTILGNSIRGFFIFSDLMGGMDLWDEFYIKIFSSTSQDWIFKISCTPCNNFFYSHVHVQRSNLTKTSLVLSAFQSVR